MAEQSPQKRRTAKSAPEDQKQPPGQEKKQDTAIQSARKMAARRRHHIRTRLKRKEKIAAAASEIKENAKKATVKGISKEKLKPQLEPMPKREQEEQKTGASSKESQTIAEVAQPAEEIYPVVAHHTFAMPFSEGEVALASGEKVQEKAVVLVPENDAQEEAKAETEAQKSGGQSEQEMARALPGDFKTGEVEEAGSQPPAADLERNKTEKSAAAEPEASEPFPELFEPGRSFDEGEEAESLETERVFGPDHEVISQGNSEEAKDQSLAQVGIKVEKVEADVENGAFAGQKPVDEAEQFSSKEATSQEHEVVEAEEVPIGGKTGVGSGGGGGLKAAIDAPIEPQGGGFTALLKHFRMRYVVLTVALVVIVFLIAGGGAAGIYRSIAGGIFGLEKPKIPPILPETRVEENLLRSWGISAAYVFAQNRGSVSDIIIPPIKNAFYFGSLAEPAVKGETGITAAYHYGQHKDVIARANLFIGYIANLRELKSLYDTDIYAMLNQTSRRETKLAEYLAKLKDVKNNSARIIKELGLQIDDLKTSHNSLNTGRRAFEQDFFAAVEELVGQKADFLLQSFIDTAQKQTALKARMSALQQLLALYEKAVKRLDVRIDAIEKNRDVLLQGLKVIDIPGANLDIVIRQK